MEIPSRKHSGNLSVASISPLIAERTRDFTGREWVFKKIDAWLSDPDGYQNFLLTGEPGSGKTAISAKLVQLSQDVESTLPEYLSIKPSFISAFHFCSARELKSINPHSFTASLALQLANRIPAFATALSENLIDEKIRIDVRQHAGSITDGKQIGVYIENLDVSRVSAEDAFVRVIRNPLEVVFHDQPGLRVVILVDGLDETLAYRGEIGILPLLAQSETLPDNVRLLLTSRQEPRVETEFLNAEGLYISGDQYNELNDEDIRNYIKHQTHKESILNEKISQFSSEEQRGLLNAIIRKAAGNFLYITFLLGEFVSGKRELTDLIGLPVGMDGLYYQSLERITRQGQRTWEEVYAPVIGVLSVSQTGLSPEQLVGFTKVSPEIVWQALVDLEQFIQRSEPETDERSFSYQLYHQSVSDFLDRQYISLEKKHIPSRYYLPAETLHRRIADYYWENFQSEWSRSDTYGLNYLAIHLFHCKAFKRLSALIDQDWLGVRYKNNGFTYLGFLSDLDFAWQAVQFQEKDPESLIALVRLQTARIVISQEVSVFSDTDLQILALRGRKEEALAHASLRPTTKDRFAGLLAIESALGIRNQPEPELLDQAWSLAQSIKSATTRTYRLTQLAERFAELGDERFDVVIDEALDTAEYVTDNLEKARRMMWICDLLVKTEQWDKAHLIAHRIPDLEVRVETLCNLARAMAKNNDNRTIQILDEALQEVDNIQTIGGFLSACNQLVAAMRVAGDDRATALFDFIYSNIHEAIETGYRASYLKDLATTLAGSGEVQAATLLQEAWDDIRTRPVKDQAVSLSLLVQELTRVGFYDQAIQVLSTIDDDDHRPIALRHLARALSLAGDKRKDEFYDKAVTLALTLQDNESLWWKPSDLVKDLIEAGELEQAYQLASSIHSPADRANALSSVARELALEGDQRAEIIFENAQRAAKSSVDLQERLEALFSLASAFNQIGDDCAEQIMSIVWEFIQNLSPGIYKTGNTGTYANILSSAGRFDEALQVVELIEPYFGQADILGKIAFEMITAGDDRAVSVFNRAIVSSQDENVHPMLPNPRQSVMEWLVRAGRFFDAEQISEGITDPSKRASALTYLGWSLHGTNRERATEILKQARVAADMVEFPRTRAERLGYLALALVSIGDVRAKETFDDALAIAQGIESNYERSWAFGKLIINLAEAGQPEKAIEIIHMLPDQEDQVAYMSHLVEILTKAENEYAEIILKDIDEITEKSVDGHRRREAQLHLSNAFAYRGQFAYAFTRMGSRSVEEFLRILAGWIDRFIQFSPDTAGMILREAIRVVGWKDPYWLEIHQLLSAAGQSPARPDAEF